MMFGPGLYFSNNSAFIDKYAYRKAFINEKNKK